MRLATYDGEGWKAVGGLPSGFWELNGMGFVSADEGFAVGPNGAILHYY
jgi:photosystem II stability/assembly factor-like uncharacterized protein